MTIIKNKERGKEGGFTLIELSIVLVIIGLIVGGILAGQTLIVSAQVRATISQLTKFQTAVNTFRGKYDCLPGDCPNLRSQFGFSTDPNGNNVQVSDGNGDGCIVDCTGYIVSGGNVVQGSEAGLFWYHLQQAGYLDASYNNTWYGYAVHNERYVPSAMPGVNWWAGYIGGAGVDPPVNPSSYAHVSGFNSNAFFLAGLWPPCGTFSCGGTIFSEGLTPPQAMAIDGKIDDGLPLTGNAIAVAAGNYLQTSPSAGTWASGNNGATGPCVVSSSTNQYAANNFLACALVFKMTTGL